MWLRGKSDSSSHIKEPNWQPRRFEISLLGEKFSVFLVNTLEDCAICFGFDQNTAF